MDAIHFINEVNRMCKSHDKVCTGCPLMNSNCLVNDFDVEAEKVVPIVEKWSEEHPKIVNGARVMKIIEEMGAPRATVSYDPNDICVYFDKDWWDAPYEEE